MAEQTDDFITHDGNRIPKAEREPPALAILYTNWRGVTAVRHVMPRGVRYGSSKWHPEPQWLLEAFDVEKGETREFAFNKIVGNML